MRILSVLVGAVFVAWIAHGLHTNPRWTWAPGEGELPRDVVAMYMDMAYKQGDVAQATKTFFSPKAKDDVAAGQTLPGQKPFEPKIVQVVAEGFNVVVQYRAPLDGGEGEYVEIFKIHNGRIAARERIVRGAAGQLAASPAASR
ncbi:hypothetical protein [Bordetella hinzii]|jgi:hypothetical protein|uniref:hypothetical protein n=1 Tax=Bordetella hinzii TaxID=103855 RepID=UPI0004599B5E|nr:hypothetical protein [Bordetella hinzii]KCB46641.1 hypothetical protein L538_3769 [Bordetella hinzii 4161]KXA74012.1 hypothetical protein AXA74_05100 [Bordetella hinzii LMG 13501]QDJ37501.1 hypothetical protein CBR67_12995 [Bordetella hinzii]QII86695.1 hypothetical protein G3T20_19575 [Bordetella hinzii]VEH25566.1 Uncharacterised protein [Bordetella hinzii]